MCREAVTHNQKAVAIHLTERDTRRKVEVVVLPADVESQVEGGEQGAGQTGLARYANEFRKECGGFVEARIRPAKVVYHTRRNNDVVRRCRPQPDLSRLGWLGV